MLALDRHFATLVSRYLSSDAALEHEDFPLPSLVDFPRVIQHPGDGREVKAKQIVVAGSIDGPAHRPTVEVTISVVGQITPNRSPDALSTVQHTIAALLSDRDAWYTWFAALDEEDRTGFRLLKIVGPELQTVSVDDDSRRMELPMILRFRLAVF